jgi:predicted N-acetyltransferase YhbS
VPRFSKVEKLDNSHDLSAFDSADERLNRFLKTHALPNQLLGSSTTYVVRLDGTQDVVGYYSLAAASVEREEPVGGSQGSPGRLSIPVILLARLAVDRKYHDQKVGARLLLDALRRSSAAASHIGVRALMVSLTNEADRSWFQKWGFTAAPGREDLMFLGMDAIRASLETKPTTTEP